MSKLENVSEASMEPIVRRPLTTKQLELKAKHGTPGEFMLAVVAAVPFDISADEAKAAIKS